MSGANSNSDPIPITKPNHFHSENHTSSSTRNMTTGIRKSHRTNAGKRRGQEGGGEKIKNSWSSSTGRGGNRGKKLGLQPPRRAGAARRIIYSNLMQAGGEG